MSEPVTRLSVWRSTAMGEGDTGGGRRRAPLGSWTVDEAGFGGVCPWTRSRLGGPAYRSGSAWRMVCGATLRALRGRVFVMAELDGAGYRGLGMYSGSCLATS